MAASKPCEEIILLCFQVQHVAHSTHHSQALYREHSTVQHGLIMISAAKCVQSRWNTQNLDSSNHLLLSLYTVVMVCIPCVGSSYSGGLVLSFKAYPFPRIYVSLPFQRTCVSLSSMCLKDHQEDYFFPAGPMFQGRSVLCLTVQVFWLGLLVF